jgi:hypothetical protein
MKTGDIRSLLLRNKRFKDLSFSELCQFLIICRTKLYHLERLTDRILKPYRAKNLNMNRIIEKFEISN